MYSNCSLGYLQTGKKEQSLEAAIHCVRHNPDFVKGFYRKVLKIIFNIFSFLSSPSSPSSPSSSPSFVVIVIILLLYCCYIVIISVGRAWYSLSRVTRGQLAQYTIMLEVLTGWKNNDHLVSSISTSLSYILLITLSH